MDGWMEKGEGRERGAKEGGRDLKKNVLNNNQ